MNRFNHLSHYRTGIQGFKSTLGFVAPASFSSPATSQEKPPHTNRRGGGPGFWSRLCYFGLLQSLSYLKSLIPLKIFFFKSEKPMTEAFDPIPDRRHLNKCKCGKRPHVGMTVSGLYRVACMKAVKGCGTSTGYYDLKEQAELSWNSRFLND